jgi:uncharacterized protein YggT (Ycf19 family)
MSWLHLLIQLYIYVFFVMAILSWFPTHSSSGGLASTKRFLAQITDPVLRPLRSVLPRPSFGGVGLDLSVLVAIIGLEIINRYI